MHKVQKIAVIGLGSMGFGIAKSCLKSGHKVFGFDTDQTRIDWFVSEGGSIGSLPEIGNCLDAIVVVVLNAAQTEDVLFGPDGAVQFMKAGSLVIGCATTSPEFARDMERRCGQSGVHFLDAPMSGGAMKAENGQLSFMASGSKEAFDAASDVLTASGEVVFNLGDSAGAGSAMKSVNQLLAGIHIAAMAEALTFAKTQGIEPSTFVEIISQCAGTSWMLENRAPHIVDGDYSARSQVNIWPKDLGIVLETAKSANFSAPLTAIALQQFMSAVGMGYGEEDDAAVAKVYARNAGITLPGVV